VTVRISWLEAAEYAIFLMSVRIQSAHGPLLVKFLMFVRIHKHSVAKGREILTLERIFSGRSVPAGEDRGGRQ